MGTPLTQEFIDVTSHQRRRRKHQRPESENGHNTLYHIEMYWVGCAEEDIITIASDGLHHNLGMPVALGVVTLMTLAFNHEWPWCISDPANLGIAPNKLDLLGRTWEEAASLSQGASLRVSQSASLTGWCCQKSSRTPRTPSRCSSSS